MTYANREQLRDLGSAGHEASGALIRAVRKTYEGPIIAAEVVLAMANQIGKEQVRADSPSDEGFRDRDIKQSAVERIRSLHELAGRLGLSEVLDIILEQPIPDEGGRVIKPPQEIATDPESVAVQLAILGAVDQVDASAEMPQRGKLLSVYSGGSGIDSALDDFEDV